MARLHGTYAGGWCCAPRGAACARMHTLVDSARARAVCMPGEAVVRRCGRGLPTLEGPRTLVVCDDGHQASGAADVYRHRLAGDDVHGATRCDVRRGRSARHRRRVRRRGRRPHSEALVPPPGTDRALKAQLDGRTRSRELHVPFDGGPEWQRVIRHKRGQPVGRRPRPERGRDPARAPRRHVSGIGLRTAGLLAEMFEAWFVIDDPAQLGGRYDEGRPAPDGTQGLTRRRKRKRNNDGCRWEPEGEVQCASASSSR